MDKRTVGERLQLRREVLKRSLRAAAKIGGVTNGYLCQVERGGDAVILRARWIIVQKLCRCYDIEPEAMQDALVEAAQLRGLL